MVAGIGPGRVHRPTSNEKAHYYLGLAYRREGRFAEARVELERAIALNPRNPKPYTNLGFVLLELGDPRRAETNFVEALRWNPGDKIAADALTELREIQAKRQQKK